MSHVLKIAEQYLIRTEKLHETIPYNLLMVRSMIYFHMGDLVKSEEFLRKTLSKNLTLKEKFPVEMLLSQIYFATKRYNLCL